MTESKYRAKIETDFVIRHWDVAREVVLEFAKTMPNLVSAIPGETRDQLARRLMGDDTLVADTLAAVTLIKGAMEIGAADIGDIGVKLTADAALNPSAPVEPSKLQDTWLIAQR